MENRTRKPTGMDMANAAAEADLMMRHAVDALRLAETRAVIAQGLAEATDNQVASAIWSTRCQVLKEMRLGLNGERNRYR